MSRSPSGFTAAMFISIECKWAKVKKNKNQFLLSHTQPLSFSSMQRWKKKKTSRAALGFFFFRQCDLSWERLCWSLMCKKGAKKTKKPPQNLDMLYWAWSWCKTSGSNITCRLLHITSGIIRSSQWWLELLDGVEEEEGEEKKQQNIRLCI